MSDELRTLMIRVGLICAVAAGGWHLLIKPLHHRADTLKAELTASKEEVSTGEVLINAAPRDPQFVLTSLKNHADAYQGWWTGTNPDERMYDTIREIARAGGVQLVGVEPGRTQTRIIGEGDEKTDTLLRIESSTIDATGNFGQILGFLDRIRKGLGAVRIESFHVGPFDTSGTLRIQITITRFFFEHAFRSLEPPQEVSP